MSKCKCNLHHRLAGDGCEVCNPALALEYAKQTIDEYAAEIERLRDLLERIDDECSGDTSLGYIQRMIYDGTNPPNA